ncbi:hypothetical protein AB4H89_001364 [Salmonella enterica]|nr:hypothetical protein [Salmonella enterica]ELE3133103.1 hypothetical protein [Salmonella enterica]ELF0564990.1 hypothetical protein [Salmonella enterica]ELO2078696.1 hypothetical protein [Salmonella enterica]ELO2805994.1 hypothetical protein [Salmonella enterica]
MNKLVKLSMLVASMIGTSSVIAAPQTGSMNISGSLTASTCTMSLSASEIKIQALTTDAIDAKNDGNILQTIPVTINKRSCSGHNTWVTFNNSAGIRDGIAGYGKFNFAGGKTGNPLFFTVTKGSSINSINVNNTGATSINEIGSTTMNINITRGSGTSSGYEGAYSSVLTFNLSYS